MYKRHRNKIIIIIIIYFFHIISAIDTFHKIRQSITRLKNAVNGLSGVLTGLSAVPIPPVSAGAKAASRVIRLVKNRITAIEGKVVKLDDKLYPRVRNRVESARRRTNNVEAATKASFTILWVCFNFRMHASLPN